jgi:serine phosphatase RsbU (regulator of sigma subunit)/anti-sigma regulatory factor (Ser/Thr protein kinase)
VRAATGLAPLGQAAGRLVLLRRLTAALADVMTPDDVARVALTHALEVEDVVRAGLATSERAGRELSFVSSDDDSVTPTAVRWCRIEGLADVPLAQCVRTSAPVLVRSPHDLVAAYPHMTERQLSLGTRSMAALPLLADDRPIGGLLLSFGEVSGFDDDQQAFLAAMAALVAQALKRALAFQTQQTTSELLQRSLMPESIPELEGLDLGAYYEPGGSGVDVGGDWYDVLPLPDGRVAVTLGDVMGKGVSAAIVMGQVRAALRAYALIDPSPEVVLERLDALVTSLGRPEQLVTVAYGVVETCRSRLTVAVAGHPAPLVATAGAAAQQLDVPQGAALGLGAGPWHSASVELPADALLLFFSDGLVETRTLRLENGVDELCERIDALDHRRRHPRELCARLAELMRRHDSDDDVTMLAVMSTVGVRTQTWSADFPADSSATPQARRALAGWLADRVVDQDVADTASLCLSELVTNAVIHSGTAPRVTARLDDERLLVLVQDRGHRGAARRSSDHEPTDISGRGLLLVEAMSTAWSAEHSADGTTVWFELDLSQRG